MLVVKYCYEQAVINSTTALILNDIFGIPCTVVILYYIYLYIQKRKFKSARKNIWVRYNIKSYSDLL